MFETVLILAALPFALTTLIMVLLAVVYTVAWLFSNIGTALAFAFMCAMLYAAWLLEYDPDTAAHIYNYLFR